MNVHCDDLIEDLTQPECLRKFLHYNRLPAVCKLAGVDKAKIPMLTKCVAEAQRPYIWTDPAPVLFANLDGKRVRVVMASRFGDVGITLNLKAEHGYDKRVSVSVLSEFSTSP